MVLPPFRMLCHHHNTAVRTKYLIELIRRYFHSSLSLVCVRRQEPSSTQLSLANVIKPLVRTNQRRDWDNAAGDNLSGIRVKLSVLWENRTRMHLSVDAEAVFTRNAHSRTLSKPPSLGDFWYTDFPVDGNKRSQVYDVMICVYAFVCFCVCVCVCVCLSLCVCRVSYFDPHDRLSQTRLIRMLCYWSTPSATV
jgi:hypothetical protein